MNTQCFFICVSYPFPSDSCLRAVRWMTVLINIDIRWEHLGTHYRCCFVELRANFRAETFGLAHVFCQTFIHIGWYFLIFSENIPCFIKKLEGTSQRRQSVSPFQNNFLIKSIFKLYRVRMDSCQGGLAAKIKTTLMMPVITVIYAHVAHFQHTGRCKFVKRSQRSDLVAKAIPKGQKEAERKKKLLKWYAKPVTANDLYLGCFNLSNHQTLLLLWWRAWKSFSRIVEKIKCPRLRKGTERRPPSSGAGQNLREEE